MSLFSYTVPSIGDPEIVIGFAQDQDDWTCDNWRTYYTRIKSKYGKQKAVDTIILDVGNTGMFSDVNNCKYDCGFVNFFHSESAEFENIGNIFSKVYCGANQVVDTTTDVVQDVGGSIKNVSTSAKLITSPVVIIGALLFVGYLYYNKNGKK